MQRLKETLMIKEGKMDGWMEKGLGRQIKDAKRKKERRKQRERMK